MTGVRVRPGLKGMPGAAVCLESGVCLEPRLRLESGLRLEPDSALVAEFLRRGDIGRAHLNPALGPQRVAKCDAPLATHHQVIGHLRHINVLSWPFRHLPK